MRRVVRIGELLRREVAPDVVRLEQVEREVGLTERVGERLGALGGIAAVGGAIVDVARHLLLDRQIEEARRDGEHLVEQRLVDAVPGDGEEPRIAAGGVELGGHGSAVGVVALTERLEIDRGDVHARTILAAISAAPVNVAIE